MTFTAQALSPKRHHAMPAPFTFIDLFAGIGGIRLAFERAGGRCLYTAEWDKHARKTYGAFFPDTEDHRLVGDINDAFQQRAGARSPALKPWSEDDETTVPEHDVLLAGFPCQPFSIAGVSKKNALGRAHGFDDPTQGTLFFNVKAILEARRPRAFLLENVKNLLSHDRGRTWAVIEAALTAAGYSFTYRVIDAARVVPQHRERIFIVGFDARGHRLAPGCHTGESGLWSAVDRELDGLAKVERERYGLMAGDQWPLLGPVLESHVDSKYTLTIGLWEYLQAYRAKHRAAGNGFGYGLVDEDSTYTRTISARYYKDGSEALVKQAGGRPRRLTPLECLRLQGFPAELESYFDGSMPQPVSDTQAYRQFGNSVVVPVVSAIATVVSELLDDGDIAGALGHPTGDAQLSLSVALSSTHREEQEGRRMLLASNC